MSEEKEAETTEEEQPEASPGKKKGLKLGGGIVGLIAAAYIVSMMATPEAPGEVPFEGPFVVVLSQAQPKVQVNLAGDGGDYLVMTLKAEFQAYTEAYAATRVLDPVYQAMEKDALISLGRQKSKEGLEDTVGEDMFKEELRKVVGPLLFPVHVGNEASPTQAHEESGLKPGRSNEVATMRGGFHAHKLKVDAVKKTVALDGGEAVTFEGTETDMVVINEDGLTVYVDVTGLDPEFVGEVPVGTFGHILRIFFDQFLVQ